MTNIETLKYEPIPPEFAEVVLHAGQDPSAFVRLYSLVPDTWAIYVSEDAPPMEEIAAIEGANDDEGLGTFPSFWWEIRATREWICDANDGLDGFRRFVEAF